MSRYHFLQIFRTSLNRYFFHKFSFFTNSLPPLPPPPPLNGKNLLSVAKAFFQYSFTKFKFQRMYVLFFYSVHMNTENHTENYSSHDQHHIFLSKMLLRENTQEFGHILLFSCVGLQLIKHII